MNQFDRQTIHENLNNLPILKNLLSDDRIDENLEKNKPPLLIYLLKHDLPTLQRLENNLNYLGSDEISKHKKHILGSITGDVSNLYGIVSEIEVWAYLKRNDINCSYQQEINGKKPDFLIKLDEDKIIVEVTTPNEPDLIKYRTAQMIEESKKGLASFPVNIFTLEKRYVSKKDWAKLNLENSKRTLKKCHAKMTFFQHIVYWVYSLFKRSFQIRVNRDYSSDSCRIHRSLCGKHDKLKKLDKKSIIIVNTIFTSPSSLEHAVKGYYTLEKDGRQVGYIKCISEDGIEKDMPAFFALKDNNRKVNLVVGYHNSINNSCSLYFHVNPYIHFTPKEEIKLNKIFSNKINEQG